MKIFVVVSLICLLAVAVTPRSHAFYDWQTYKVNGEEFAVSLPELPAMSTERPMVAPGTQRTQRIIGSYGDGVAYAIHTYENVMHQSLEDFVAYSKGRRSRVRQWTDQKDITVNGFPGKQFTVVERDVPGLVQFFRTKDHLYWFEAMGAPGDDPRIQRFFSSLTLGKNLEATELRDGLGAEVTNAQLAPVLRTTELDRKVVVVTKPEPSYTESARQNRITGAVIVKAVFASNGRVTDMDIISGLPNGLNDQALKAAKQIRFVPGMKSGNLASCTLQLEYHFNLY